MRQLAASCSSSKSRGVCQKTVSEEIGESRGQAIKKEPEY